MKKLLSMLLALSLLLTAFTGCGKDADSDDNKDENGTVIEADEEKSGETTEEKTTLKIMDSCGNEFAVNTTVTGEISDRIPLHKSQIILGGKTYSYPFTTADLIADGWMMYEANANREIKANSSSMLSDFKVKNADGVEIYITRVDNSSSEAKPMKDCVITKIEISLPIDEGDDFEVAGGITQNSTAADVLSGYDAPDETNTDFIQAYCGNATHLGYISASKVGMGFWFNADGSLRAIAVDFDS